MAARFAVLMYHRIESSVCPVPDEEEKPWAVPLPVFEQQMEQIASSGRIGVSMDRIHATLASGGTIPAPWVAITFDDGNASDCGHALPILSGHGFSATFFICGERIGTELAAEDVRTLSAAGMHVGSHAMTHRFMTTLGREDEESELVRSRAALEALCGAPVRHFAPPGGRWSSRTRSALERAGYVAVSTSRYGFNDAARPRFAYRRLPVVRSTSASTFDAMLRADSRRLVPGYARAAVLGAARRIMGESVYGRARALGKER